jgi:hypothetical protein
VPKEFNVNLWDLFRTILAGFFIVLFALPPHNAAAQSHVVSPNELHQQVVTSSRIRQQNVEQIDRFFSSPLAQRALRDHRIDAKQVKTAVSQLSDEELARVAARTEKAQTDFAAGAITDHLLILIVIVIAVVLIAVLAAKL